MPVKNIIHDIAVKVAEKTAPEQLAEPPQRKPLSPEDKKKLIQGKANLDAIAQKCGHLQALLEKTDALVTPYKIEQVNIKSLVEDMRQVRKTLTHHIKRLAEAMQ